MGPRVGRYLIYGLLDPRDDSLRYVGKTHKRREIRLREHAEHALSGRPGPVFDWIRELQGEGVRPVIFVLERLAPTDDWREAERAAIARWRAWPCSELPYLHPPQTRKSAPVAIRRVSLLNVAPGG